jgi:hypothetical protein
METAKSHFGTIPSLFKGLEHVSIVLEAILAELRYTRGMVERDVQFLKGGAADGYLHLDELQARRRELFRSP